MNSRQFAVVAGIAFFVGMIWLVSDIIFNTKASIPISPKLQTLLEPVNPNFNPRVLEIVNNQVRDFAPQTTSTRVAPSPSEPEATESALER